jgi:hypothetical protein
MLIPLKDYGISKFERNVAENVHVFYEWISNNVCHKIENILHSNIILPRKINISRAPGGLLYQLLIHLGAIGGLIPR